MNFELEAVTLDESTRLIALEITIKRNLDNMLEVANALLEIRDNRLYRDEFKSFKEYCEVKWGFSKARGYQLIAYAQVSTMVDTKPENERQARARKAINPPKAPAEVASAPTSPPTVDDQWKSALGNPEAKSPEPRVTEYYERLERFVEDALENASDKQLASLSVYAAMIPKLVKAQLAKRKSQ